MPRPALPFALLVALAASGASSRADAHGGESPAPLVTPPSPPGSDGAKAEAILKEIDARAAKSERAAKLVKEPVEKAKKALERAHGARAAGDPGHAAVLDALALEWTETARDLDRAAASEEVAAASAAKARETAAKVERARTLLEETQARRARAAAELERVEAEARERAKNAADTERDRVDASKKKASKGEAKPKQDGGKKKAK